jgi:hypothetical protein
MVPPKSGLVNRFLWPYNFCMSEKKKVRGRPVKADGEKLERRAVYMPPSLWAKIDAYGLDWLRDVVKRAKKPAP